MKKLHYYFIQNSPVVLVLAALFLSAGLFTLPIQAQTDIFLADSSDKRPFDFSDKFYVKNGINPAQIVNKRNGADEFSIFDVAPSKEHNNIRVKVTMPAYDQFGNLQFWYLLGEIFQTGFAEGRTGQAARETADTYKVYVFPKASGNSLALGNNRQADIVDLPRGYFENNSLGLGVIVFVNYTREADVNMSRTLAALAARNGLSTDGTPIIKTTGELEDLMRKGFITQTIRSFDGSQGPSWLIRPVIEDPRYGAIAPDAFLVPTRNNDGSPFLTEAPFIENFNCLRRTGDWCKD